jgi:hypothetical protein
MTNKSINVNFDKILPNDEECLSILPDFTNARQLVLLLNEWEKSIFQKISTILESIETYYY